MNMNLKAHLLELEQKHISLEVRKSREKLAEILADDFFEIGSSGSMFNKSDCLKEGVAATQMSLHNYEIYPLSSEVVLATYFIVDTTRERNTYRSSLWKFTGGKWQLFFHQGTISPLELSEVQQRAE